MGSAFEETCRAFLRRPKTLAFNPIRVGEWWDSSSENQVDVVALGEGGDVLVGECKWGAVDPEDVRKLRQRADLVIAELPGTRHVHLALFSGRGEPSRALRAELAAAKADSFGPKELFSV